MISKDDWLYLSWVEAIYFQKDPAWWMSYHASFSKYTRRQDILKILNYIGGGEMARGKGKTNAGGAARGKQWTEFVNVSIGEVEYEDVLDKVGDNDALYDKVAQMLETGHRVSFSYNYQNDSVVCSATGREEDCVNAGMTLTAYADNWVDALRVVLYKHYVVCDTTWGSQAGQRNTRRFG